MPEELAVLVRWIHIFGMSLLVGIVGFRWLVARPTAREGGREAAAAFVALDAQLLVVATGTLVVTVLAGVLDLWRQVCVATGASLWSVDVGGFGAVLAHTRYGWVWLGREACLLLLAAWCVIQTRGPEEGSRLGSDVAAGALATVALLLGTAASHAASAQGWPLVAMTVDAAHLLATGVWFGGLLPLALSLGHVRGLPPRLAARVAAVGAQRFSRLAFWSVSALVATGIYNAWIQVGTIPGLVGTPYGRWLLLKIGLLLAVLVLAASNRFGLIPRLLRASAPRSGGDAPAIVRRLRRQVARGVRRRECDPGRGRGARAHDAGPPRSAHVALRLPPLLDGPADVSRDPTGGDHGRGDGALRCAADPWRRLRPGMASGIPRGGRRGSAHRRIGRRRPSTRHRRVPDDLPASGRALCDDLDRERGRALPGALRGVSRRLRSRGRPGRGGTPPEAGRSDRPTHGRSHRRRPLLVALARDPRFGDAGLRRPPQ